MSIGITERSQPPPLSPFFFSFLPPPPPRSDRGGSAPAGDGANIVLPTLSAAYTSVDDLNSISGVNLSMGDNVSLIIALGDTSVDHPTSPPDT